MTLHTYTPLPMSLPNIPSTYTFALSEIQRGQTFFLPSTNPAKCLLAYRDIMGENHTLTALKS